jgi:pimeloyl-ACP methyl ester carboxylesterase
MAGERVLALDLPGHDRSGAKGSDSISSYTASVVDLLDDLEIDQVVLAGHSMGSAILLLLYLQHPERVKGLILLGGGAKLPVNPELIRYCSQEETYPKVVSMVMKWSFSPAADRRLVELAGERMAETPSTIVLGDFQACAGFDVRDRLGEIKAETLIICGVDDKMAPRRFSEYLASEIPKARLEIVPEAGHMVMLEKPEIVASLIKEFLDEISLKPGELAN